ncbi:hypothetical protein C9439_00155 [archaeon SCG-AAA382B04]|nr:hypothetical protein C9439_00155 [archaeon SCG-AAA382B04]
MSKIELEKKQINELLNLASVRDVKEIWLEYPLLKTRLFKISLENGSWSCEQIISREKYRQRRQKHDFGDIKEREIPLFHDIIGALVAAGAFEPKEYGKELKNALKTISGNPNSFSLAFDTNILYKRFISSTLHPLLQKNPHALKDAKWLLSNLVRKETNRKVGRKYRQEEIKAFKERVNCFGLLNNSPKLKSRRSKLASTELNYLQNRLGIDLVGDKNWSDDKEDRDTLIIEEYHNPPSERKPIFFTFDHDLKTKAENYGLITANLNTPRPKDLEIGQEKIHKLIRYLSQLFGVIHLKGLDVDILGVWTGMEPNSYQNGKITCLIDNNNDLTNKLEKTAVLSNKLKSLM